MEMAAAAETADENYKKGVLMTVTIFITALTRLGVAEIEAEGKEFDPNIHSAIGQEPAGDENVGKVLRVAQKGYTLGERVIRPAMVIVGAAE